MVFSSMVFLGMFLPAVCLGYYICPKKLRNVWLLLASLFFYGYGETVYLWIMICSTVFDYGNGRLIDYWRRRGKDTTYGRGVLILSVVGNLGILGFFKYTDFILGTVNQLTGSNWKLLELALPLGISFYTFQTMSYTIDVYRGKVACQKNFLDFAMYVCLFPQLIAGPIVRYRQISEEISKRSCTLKQISLGLQRFSMGLGKKVLLANQLGAISQRVLQFTGEDQSMAVAWLGAIAYTFQIYFDFSGYSDMAIGLGMMFGFHFPENFRYPYESGSVTEFWRRWHITLGSWFREYVYIPLGGNRKGYLRQVCNLLLVWGLTGLWHGAGWNFVLWGLYYFLLLLLEKTYERWKKRREKCLEIKQMGQTAVSSGKRKKGIWIALLRHVYTMLAVIFGWVLFSVEQCEQILPRLKQLLCIGVPGINRLAVYEWRNGVVLLCIALVAATSVPKRLVTKYLPEPYQELAGTVYSSILLVVCVAFLVSGSYNPFLYFRF